MKCTSDVLQSKKFCVFTWLLFCCFFGSFASFSQTDIKKDIQNKISMLRDHPNFEKDTIYINLLHKLGREHYSYNLDSLLILSKEAISLSQAIKYTKGEAQGYLNKGHYYSDKGKQDQAIACFSKALSKATKINETKIILQSTNELAKEYTYKFNYSKGLKTYLKGIEIAKKNNNDFFLSIYYVNISVLYSDQKEYDQAIIFLKKAMLLNKKNDDKKITGISLSNLAFTYIQIGDLENASLHVDEAISIFETLELDSWLTYVYELKGTISLKQNQFNEALVWLEKSEDLYENIDQRRYQIPLNLLISKAYFGLNDYKTSKAYAIKALDISKELHLIGDRDEVLELLYNIEKKNNNPKKALAYFEDFKTIADTINKNNNKRALRILEARIEFEQEKELYLLDNERKHANQQHYVIFLVLIIITFLIIIVILKKHSKTQKTLNQELIKNTKVLEKNKMRLNEANATKNKLFSIIAHDLKGPINAFKMLLDVFHSSDLGQEEFIKFMPQLGQSIDSIAFTLNNLLNWGQTQMNGLITKSSFTNIKTLVDENMHLLSKQTEGKSIQVINTIAPNTIGWFDKNQIDIVIRNLISNAMKFTPKHGLITINASEKPGFLIIEIKDNGVGISEDTLDKIFKDVEIITSYGTMNEKGTGLGLRVCKEMVKNNGGHIWAKSELNQGASFYFTVPKTESH